MIRLHPIFKLREQVTEGIIQLLESVTLGTDGAHYRHLDTRERVHEADNPLFLSMERNEKVLGNITFCRRKNNWYIRYFAFSAGMQAGGKQKSNAKEGLLRRELEQFFQQVMEIEGVDKFYAYIDPRNVKSLWMSENFGFSTVGKVATQTFSRTKWSKTTRVSTEDGSLPNEVSRCFKDRPFYFDDQLNKLPYYSIRDDNGELLAFAKGYIADWEISRLPGKWGGVLTKLIPYVPFVRKVIRPKSHSFLVPEAVYIKNDSPALLNELFEGMLSIEKKNLLIWWVDEKDPLYSRTKNDIRWGLLNKMVGTNHADIVVRSKDGNDQEFTEPIYASGFDFI